MTAPARSGPSSAGYVIGSLLLVAGIAVGIVGAVVGVSRVIDTIDHYQRFPVRSGEVGRTVVLSKTGRYSLFYEAPGVKSVSQIPPIRVEITGPTGLQVVGPEYTGSSQSYQFSGRQGARFARFNVLVAGRYTFQVKGAALADVPTDASLAVGRDDFLKGVEILVIGLVGGGIIGLIGIVVLIATAVRRSNHRRQVAPAWAPQPWAAPPPAWGGPAQQPGPWTPPPAGWNPPPPGWNPPPAGSNPPPPGWNPPPQESGWGQPSAPPAAWDPPAPPGPQQPGAWPLPGTPAQEPTPGPWPPPS
ncbi:MAG: hypothetical protein JWN46_2645, partial [Acidimicrobiales bacterium]|nr:hypothetical protein [Acidimicrobiales bacterium]